MTEPIDIPAVAEKIRTDPKIVGPAAKPEKKPIEKVVSGKTVVKKRGVGSKIKESLAGDDMASVGDYILLDVFIPAVKTLISEMFSQGIERLLFGDTIGRSRARSQSFSHTSYNKMYKSSSTSSHPAERQVDRRTRATHDFDNVLLETRDEAEQILDALQDHISEYGAVSVADLYDMIGATSQFVDNKWGWTNLSGSSVRRVRDGYQLLLPRTIEL